MRIKRTAAFLILLVFLCGCAKKPSEPQTTPGPTPSSVMEESAAVFEPSAHLIGMLCKDQTDLLYTIPVNAFLRTAENLNLPAKVYKAASAHHAELQIDSMLSDNCEAIVIWAQDSFFDAAISKAAGAGIKVVVPFYKKEGTGIISNLHADETEYLTEALRIFDTAIKPKNYESGKIVINSVFTTKATASILKSIIEASGYIAEEFTTATEDKQAEISQYVLDNPNLVGVIDLDNTAAMWVKAKKDVEAALKPTPTPKSQSTPTPKPTPKPTPLPSGATPTPAPPKTPTPFNPTKRDFLIIAMDYLPENIDMVNNGSIYGFIARPFFDSTAQATMLLDRALRGKTVPRTVALNAPLIRKSGLAKYSYIVSDVKTWFNFK